MNKVRQFHELTLNDVIILDATKSAKHLMKYWFIPIYLCLSELEKLSSEIFTSIGDNSIDELQVKISKLISYRNLLKLDALNSALHIEIDLKPRISVWKLILDGDFKESEQLQQVLIEVKKETGIDIKTPEDLTVFKEYYSFKIDKYKETYPDEKPEEKKPDVKLQRILYSVFRYMGEPYNVNMLLSSFVEMKQEAEEQIRKQQMQQDNEGSEKY